MAEQSDGLFEHDCERRVRTLFISDTHLGCRYSRPDALYHFLGQYRPDQLFLVGDVVDGWKLSRRWHWQPIYNRILDRLREMMGCGTQITYLPGNHDALFRNPLHRRLLTDHCKDLVISDEVVFKAADGRRFLVTHGDRFDWFETNAVWLSKLLMRTYDPLLGISRWRHRFGGSPSGNPYAICNRLKRQTKSIAKFVSAFQQQLITHAERVGCDGIICGHLHSPTIAQSDSVIYCNTGDWVENCTGLIERFDGTLELHSHYQDLPLQTLPPRKQCHLSIA
ncbi:UDP-2,3-diacylglucosamine pyrophosphatase LpxH [Neorhodopirellula lusitana]|uniref:UDP-2,3-diacylglucosamine pyrophosphatase LpxH n=1 Tax=Neorhodopirellula lusitana TaxID=445327 RepID=A0ABY1QCX5_9BACT|nr:UDP-2,3-diacylglucosamine diphosphatase [Neorhodopirellula lusitana]SMP65690.1 UDP-2,3-diacylglucosamine pyrophosphatase LpxH [Neorhodopirellula lusitana]